jgi:hypothetical protein
MSIDSIGNNPPKSTSHQEGHELLITVWEKVFALPSIALLAPNLGLFWKVDDCVAVLPSATLTPDEYVLTSNTWMGCPVIDCNFTFCAFG